MAASSSDSGGRIANVTAVVWLEDSGVDSAEAGAARASELARFFAEVQVAPAATAGEDGVAHVLDRLASVLSGASADRVLIVGTSGPAPPTSLILGLTAWPEHDAVVTRRGGRLEPLCGIYRRLVVCDAARVARDAGVTSIEGLLDRIDTDPLADDDLAAIDAAEGTRPLD